MDFNKIGVVMRFVYFLFLSIISGILAGMGMGGGTLLIPILTMIMKVDQLTAQATNLLVFIPCSITVCLVYAKNKLIDFKGSWLISVVASTLSILAVIVAVKLKSELLSTIFGIFLIVLGFVQFVVQIVNTNRVKSAYVKRKQI